MVPRDHTDGPTGDPTISWHSHDDDDVVKEEGIREYSRITLREVLSMIYMGRASLRGLGSMVAP